MDDVTRRDMVKMAAVGGAVTLGVPALAAGQEEAPQPRAAGGPPGRQEINDAIGKATDEANEVFAKMQSLVDEQVRAGTKSIDVVRIARGAGLEIDHATLDELKIDHEILVIPWLPWHHWWPWRPLWCWWWHRYPWYRCCPYWWHRCHWYPW